MTTPQTRSNAHDDLAPARRFIARVSDFTMSLYLTPTDVGSGGWLLRGDLLGGINRDARSEVLVVVGTKQGLTPERMPSALDSAFTVDQVHTLVSDHDMPGVSSSLRHDGYRVTDTKALTDWVAWNIEPMVLGCLHEQSVPQDADELDQWPDDAIRVNGLFLTSVLGLAQSASRVDPKSLEDGFLEGLWDMAVQCAQVERLIQAHALAMGTLGDPEDHEMARIQQLAERGDTAADEVMTALDKLLVAETKARQQLDKHIHQLRAGIQAAKDAELLDRVEATRELITHLNTSGLLSEATE